jgi:hypothetical protein
LKNYTVVSLEPVERRINDIRILPWQVFLRELWTGER